MHTRTEAHWYGIGVIGRLIGFSPSRFSFEAPFLLFLANNGIVIAITGEKGESTTRTH